MEDNPLPMKTFFLALLITVSQLPALAQQTFDFSTDGKALPARRSFRRVMVIDRRSDTARLIGSIKVNAAKGYENLSVKTALADELGAYYQRNCPVRSEKEQTLVIILYAFRCAELPAQREDGRESASFHYSADFFAGDSLELYRMLGSVDTEVFVTAFDVTERTLRLPALTISRTYTILRGHREASDRNFTLKEVRAYDPADRLTTLPFSGKLPRSGYYEEWNDFLCLRPAKGIRLETVDNNVSIYRARRNGKRKAIRKPSGIVIIQRGKPYYRSHDGYREMKMGKEGFYVTTPIAPRPQEQTSTIPAQSMFGMLGTAVLSLDKKEVMPYYKCVVNARTGALMPLSQAEAPAPNTYLTIQ